MNALTIAVLVCAYAAAALLMVASGIEKRKLSWRTGRTQPSPMQQWQARLLRRLPSKHRSGGARKTRTGARWRR